MAQIRAAVLNKEIVAGQFLGSEAALSEQFGVSRMAARDALRTLEGLGIVEIRMGSRGGVWVAQGNPDRLADAMAIHLKLIGVTSGEVFDAQMAIEEMAALLWAYMGHENASQSGKRGAGWGPMYAHSRPAFSWTGYALIRTLSFMRISGWATSS